MKPYIHTGPDSIKSYEERDTLPAEGTIRSMEAHIVEIIQVAEELKAMYPARMGGGK